MPANDPRSRQLANIGALAVLWLLMGVACVSLPRSCTDRPEPGRTFGGLR